MGPKATKTKKQKKQTQSKSKTAQENISSNVAIDKSVVKTTRKRWNLKAVQDPKFTVLAYTNKTAKKSKTKLQTAKKTNKQLTSKKTAKKTNKQLTSKKTVQKTNKLLTSKKTAKKDQQTANQ